MSTLTADDDRPSVIARPPLIFLTFLLFAAALHLVSPFPLMAEWLRPVLALPALACGILLMLSAVRRFRDAGTNIPTPMPTLRLVTGGVYRYSRNPMYLSLSLIYLGFAAGLNSLWALLLFLPLQLILHVGVILREEAYMAEKFGLAYQRYRARVPRWL